MNGFWGVGMAMEGGAPWCAERRMSQQVEKVKEAVITTKEFLEGLGRILPRPVAGLPPPPMRFRDAEFDKISNICKKYNRHAWGLRPRTFVILHMIGCVEALDSFVAENIFDISLPYNKDNLPRAIKGSKARAQFLEYQHYVLTSHAADLEKPGGKHQNVEGSADEFFWTVKDLGSGGFGTVDQITSKLSYTDYARKRIPRGRSFKRDKEAIRMFENELTTLKALGHRHLVKLIGSYTDGNFVGLIMHPVADMNLAKYLSGPDPLEDRSNCLRRFYGCLASAVDYLHSQNVKVRHKDIKPENILVKDKSVLLADFGTSHNWADDNKSSTSGTVVGFTKRYCAPEVAAYASRNPASDIWSLGCVFIEMSTVLMNRTIQEMREFYQDNGTKGHYIRDNMPATELWMQELKSSASIPEDIQTLTLGKSMCNVDPMARPTASELASDIFDLKGPPAYFGFCCDRENYTLSTTDSMEQKHTHLDSQETLSKNLSTLEVSETPAEDDDPAIEDPSSFVQEPSYQRPYYEDVEDNITLRAVYPSERDIEVDKQNSNLEEETPTTQPDTIKLNTVVPTSIDQANLSLQLQIVSGKQMVESLNRLDHSNLICIWPTCIIKQDPDTFDGTAALQSHHRSAHGVHDFQWTRLTQRSANLLLSDFDPEAVQPLLQEVSESQPLVPGPCNMPVHLPDVAAAPPTDIYSDALAKVVAERKRQPHHNNTGSTDSADTKVEHVMVDTEGFASSTSTKVDNTDSGVRFSMLPAQNRPAPIETASEVRLVDSASYDITAEALEEPKITFTVPASETAAAAGAASNQQNSSIPKFSLAPSYFLASMNRFTKREIETLLPGTRLSSLIPPPVFVYGRLMFPSVLRAVAERFSAAEGIYSRPLQRRLKTDSSDWAKANFSLQHAAEQMTPAVLKGYDRWKVQGCWGSAAKSIEETPEIMNGFLGNGETVAQPPGEIHGFVIFGLSAEAMLCLDHTVTHNEKTLFDQDADSKPKAALEFSRRDVEVEIALNGGGNTTFKAITYTWAGEIQRLRPRWNINRFVRSNTFNKLSFRSKSGDVYTDEERKLASTMGISYVLVGDALCSAVLDSDVNTVLDLLDDGYDANAPCTTYGNPLQAAAFKGDEAVVRLLIEHDADVNAQGGHYYRPLIAATVQGHEDIARMLIKEGADILADGGEYISAIYQAVNFSDQNLVHLLLEKGAWLTTQYRELLDVAAERGNREIIHMLQDYDVRMLHTRPAIEDAQPNADSDSVSNTGSASSVVESRSRDDADRRVTVKPLSVVRAVGLEVLLLKGTKGKWTGIKGVRLMKAAIRAGVSPKILDTARPHLSSYQKALDFLQKSVIQMNEEQQNNGAISTTPLQLLMGSNGSNEKAEVKPAAAERSQEEAVRGDSGKVRFNVQEQDRDKRRPQPGNRDKEFTCTTCNGKGCRRGTERKCTYCNGLGRETFYKNSRSRETYTERCQNCNARGITFSKRDTCQACNGSGRA